MVVYWEYAFLENFLLDGLLLYLSLKCAKGKIRFFNLFLAAGVGAAEAIVFPIIPFPVWAAYLAKLLGGVLIAVIAVCKGTGKTYLVVTVAFFLLTFALGGLLTAAYSFFGLHYEEGNGYLVEQAPIGLILGGAGVFAVLVLQGAKFLYRYRKIQQNVVSCTLESGGKQVHWKGFADSGNCLLFQGKPVCVVSWAAVFALFGKNPKSVGRLAVSTVNGSKEAPVFACDRMTVNGTPFETVLLTVGEIGSKEYQLILHTAFMEGNHEIIERSDAMATKVREE